MAKLAQAKILITNFHAFKLREKINAGKLTKVMLAEGDKANFTETPNQMVRRVYRESGNKKNIIVKVPRVPVADNSMQGDQPTYRDL